MDSKKIIWTIVLIAIILGAGFLFYKNIKPYISRPAPAAGPEMAPNPAVPPEGAAPNPAAVPAEQPAAPAPAPAEAPK